MLNFPDAPTASQIFTSGSVAWQWDGVKWVVYSTITTSGDASPILVTGNVTLPAVNKASVNVSNSTGAGITIILPAASVSDQTYRIKDILGNASTYPIRILPTAGTIDGRADTYLYQDYQAVELYWAGLWCVR